MSSIGFLQARTPRKDVQYESDDSPLLLAMLVSAILSSSGCIHTWTGTYAEYPESAYDKPHVHVQGDPHDG